MNPVFVHDPRRGTRSAQPVLARRQSGPRQGLDDQHDRICRGRRDQAHGGAADAGRLRADRRPLQEAVPQARRRRRRRADARVHRSERGRPDGQDAVRLVDRRRQEADQGWKCRRRSSTWSRSAGSTGGPCNISPVSTSRSWTRTITPKWRTCRRQYKEALEARESSIDSIARAMSELAASSKRHPPAAVAAVGDDAPDRGGDHRRRPRPRRAMARLRCRLPTRTCRSAPTARPATRTCRNCSRRPGSSSTAPRRKWVISFPARSTTIKVTPELKAQDRAGRRQLRRGDHPCALKASGASGARMDDLDALSLTRAGRSRRRRARSRNSSKRRRSRSSRSSWRSCASGC